MSDHHRLRRDLLAIDQRGYKAYKDIRGSYRFPDFILIIDWVQGDPFASPSHCRVRLSQTVAGFPQTLFATPSREVALRDYLTRQFDRATQKLRQRRGTGNSGLLAIARPGQEILGRTSVLVDEDWVEARFVVGLPAQGRRIDGVAAAQMLCELLPQLVTTALIYAALDADAIQTHVETAEDADWLRSQLAGQGLVAFVADGAVLPRRSGVDNRPLLGQVVAFQSPESLQVAFHCPNRGWITGMGILQGVSLIVGGGYHGKSTLLQAIELGVYNHIPGDGREFVLTDAAAVKIRAEDGRSVTGVDISPFINDLPQGRSTTRFSTQNASGSTSQAANIMEALELEAQLLLVDEDTTATNLMIRDRRMQALIAKAQEPITPFIDKVEQLYRDRGVSTILVMGGSGDYFDVATTVIAMENFAPRDVTAQAQAIAHQHPTFRTQEGGHQFGQVTPRTLSSGALGLTEGHKPVKWKVRDLHTLVLDKEVIDFGGIEQVVDEGQLKAIAAAMVYLQTHVLQGEQSLATVIHQLMAELETHGLDQLSTWPQGDFVQFRPFELAAAINRWRRLQTDSGLRAVSR